MSAANAILASKAIVAVFAISAVSAAFIAACLAKVKATIASDTANASLAS